MKKISSFEKMEEVAPLTDDLKQRPSNFKMVLHGTYRREEIMWYQRARSK